MRLCSVTVGTPAETKPITVHFPKEVCDQLKILAVKQGTTLQALVGESFNMSPGLQFVWTLNKEPIKVAKGGVHGREEVRI